MKGYRSLTRALALSCAAVALTPGVAPAASPDTPPCPHGTRAATGMAGTGCTTSSPNDVDAVAAALVVILSGAGAFAIVRDVRRPAGRRRRGPSTEAALAERA